MVEYRNVFFALREALLDAALKRAGSLATRLWMERRSSRPIVNWDDVKVLLDRYGFTTVDMAMLPVARQIAAVHHAQVLGGAHGAAMVHSMFLPERATVIECLSPLFVNSCILDFCQNLRLRYEQLVQSHKPYTPSAYRYGWDVEVNCQHLELVLQSLP
jgi:capsular polysaccharide biosynthesis protein